MSRPISNSTSLAALVEEVNADRLRLDAIAGGAVYGPSSDVFDTRTTDDSPLTHEWVAEDLADPDLSFWGDKLVYLMEWTPTESGPVILAAPLGDGTTEPDAEIKFEIFEGDLSQAPDLAGTRPSGTIEVDSSWSYDAVLAEGYSAAGFDFAVTALQPYVLAATHSEGLDAVGRTVSLREWVLSVQTHGGTPQLFPSQSATGFMAVADGYATEASGDFSRALGYGSVSSGEGAVAAGRLPVASGDASVALGGVCTASGEAAVAMGERAVASGSFATAIGRGRASGDRSVVLGSGTASGDDAFVSAGGTATGVRAVALGQSTLASAAGAVALGVGSHAQFPSDLALGSQGFTGTGSSQHVIHVSDGSTFDATPAAALAVSLPPASRAVSFTGEIIARSTDGTLAAAWSVLAVARVDGDGVITLVGTPTVTLIGADAGAAAWDASAPSAGAGYLAITCTGAAATEIHWSMGSRTQEVG